MLLQESLDCLYHQDEVLYLGLFDGMMTYTQVVESLLLVERGSLLSLPFQSAGAIDGVALVHFQGFRRLWLGDITDFSHWSPTMLQITPQDHLHIAIRTAVLTRFNGHLDKLPREWDWRLEMHEMAVLEARLDAGSVPWYADRTTLLCSLDFFRGQQNFTMQSQRGILLTSCKAPDGRRYAMFGLVCFPQGVGKYVPLPAEASFATPRGGRLRPFRIDLANGAKTCFRKKELELPEGAQSSFGKMAKDLFEDPRGFWPVVSRSQGPPFT
jgi:hypothetical protein